MVAALIPDQFIEEASEVRKSMIDVTPLLLTFDEKENLHRTLARLRWAERIVVVDSFSTDGTVESARTFSNVELVQRRFDTFAGQCNFGLTHVHTPWVLSLDADYLLTPELSAEILALKPESETSGYAASFRYCVWGRPLRSTLYPPRTVLYRRELARYEDDGHGHRVRVTGPVRSLAGRIDHDDRKPLSRWLQSQDRYMHIEAPHLLHAPVGNLSRADRLRRGAALAPVVMFLYLLFGRGLIFDGWPGLFYVFQRTLAETLLALRLISEREGMEPGGTRHP